MKDVILQPHKTLRHCIEYVHEKAYETALEKALNEVLKDKNIGIILLTEALGKKYPELVKTVRTEHKKPLLIEIPDRHGTGRRPDFITAYVNDAIGLKL